jgi:prepilin-type N-terminal cleavage/methylation domain-containing protein
MSRKGFTLIELLVVIAIIALLMSIIVPSIRKAKEHAQRLVCGTNLHQIQIACVAYANDNNDFFPDRGKTYDGYPHAMINEDTGKSLDETFFVPYLSDMRDKVLFCPGALHRYRNAEMEDIGYAYEYITYQYFNYPEGNPLWVAPQSNLAKYSRARQTSPLWACLTVGLLDDLDPVTGQRAVRLSHNMVDQDQPQVPSGMNAVSVSGDTAWTQWKDCGAALKITTASSQTQLYYWSQGTMELDATGSTD